MRLRKIIIKPAYSTKGKLQLNTYDANTVKPNNSKVTPQLREGRLNNIMETTFLKTDKKRVFIIGGGPSLINFDFSILKDEDVICVNKAIEYVDNPTYFITMDYTFFGKTSLSIDDIVKKAKSSHFIVNASNYCMQYIDGVFIDTKLNFKYDSLNKLTSVIVSNDVNNNATGFGLTLNNFANGQNSGFSAVQFAILAGYTEIYLLGFDLSDNNGLTHFHSGYQDTHKRFNNDISIFKDTFISAFQKFGTSKFYTTSDKSVLSSIITYVPLSKINDIIKT